jgi:hypothetical protein
VNLDGLGCSVPVTAGSITVPSSLLRNLGTGAGSIILSSFNDVNATGSNAAVVLRVDATIQTGAASFQ